MPKAKIHAILRVLASGPGSSPVSLGDGSRREWRRVLDWLDASGLALYFHERLKERNATDALPPEVLVQLDERRSKNRERVRRIAQKFRMLNDDFHQEGIEYAALKGFSLVPEYCPDASLRALSDLDYLIGKDSLARAEKVLAARGYTLNMRARFPQCWWTQHRGEEFIFSVPASPPTKEIEQYYPEAPCPVELHVTAGDLGGNARSAAVSELAADRLARREWEGAGFFSLPEPEIFVGQARHAFLHWALGSIRPSWLYEIGYFLRGRQDEDPLWEAVNRLIDSDSPLAEAVGIMVRLTSLVFGQVHAKAGLWAAALHPAIQRWLEMYGRGSVLEACKGYDAGLFPRSKLMLFIQEHYSPDVQTALGLRGRSPAAVRALRGLVGPGKRTDLSKFDSVRRKVGWFASRSLHHAGANLRYFWELPRWRGVPESRPRLAVRREKSA